MFASNRRPGIGSTAASGLLFDSEIRHAAAQAAAPVARLGFSVGKRWARRRTRQQMQQATEAITTLATLVAAYGPMLAEQLGLVEPPKPASRRAAPVLIGGSVIAAGAYYLFDPRHGREHRQQFQRLFVH